MQVLAWLLFPIAVTVIAMAWAGWAGLGHLQEQLRLDLAKNADSQDRLRELLWHLSSVPVTYSRRAMPAIGDNVARLHRTLGGTVALSDGVGGDTGRMTSSSASAFAGFRFPREVKSVAVRWYLRYGLSYRDVEELLAERGVTVDHVTVFRWVQRFTAEFVEAARTRRHVPGDRWFVDETYVKVNGRWTYLYRAIDQYGQVIDVWLSTRRDLAAARTFFTRALTTAAVPVEVTTDRAPAYPRVLDELVPGALHATKQYANNGVEADHGRLKARLRPMRVSRHSDRLGSLPPVMRSYRTSDGATTRSPPTQRLTSGCRSPSVNWHSLPDPPGGGSTMRPRAANATEPPHQQPTCSSTRLASPSANAERLEPQPVVIPPSAPDPTLPRAKACAQSRQRP